MAIKCIALDMDGTTLNKKEQLSAENRRALEDAIQKGIHIIIASGRAFDTLPEAVLSVPGVEYAVTSNGAAMYHIPTRKCMHRNLLKPEAVEAILELTKEDTVSYEGFINGAAHAARAYLEDPVKYGATPEAISYVQRTRILEEDITAFLLANKQQLDCMDIIVRNEQEKERIEEKLQKQVADIYITSSVKQLLEISDSHCGKHAGVQYFMEHLGLQKEEVAAFGDADNDIDMLKFVGSGVAMGNGSKRCKAAADYITLDHDVDGVAYGMRKILKVI